MPRTRHTGALQLFECVQLPAPENPALDSRLGGQKNLSLFETAHKGICVVCRLRLTGARLLELCARTHAYTVGRLRDSLIVNDIPPGCVYFLVTVCVCVCVCVRT